MDIFKHSNEKQVSISSLVIFRRISLPMNSCGGCPVGTWGVSQVNLMKNSAVIGSWMPKLTKARLNEGSEVKIGLAFASGLPCLAHWILQVTKFIFAITNWLQLVQVGIRTWLEICSTARKSFCGPLWKQEVIDWSLRGHKDTREDRERHTCTYVPVLSVYTYTPMQINTHFPPVMRTQGQMCPAFPKCSHQTHLINTIFSSQILLLWTILTWKWAVYEFPFTLPIKWPNGWDIRVIAQWVHTITQNRIHKET